MTPEPELTQQETPAKKRRWRPSRRGFLIGLGVVGGGLALGYVYGVPWVRLRLAGVFEGAEGPPGNFPEDPAAWFEVLPDSRVRLYLMKVEMGQGIHTSLAQVAADKPGRASNKTFHDIGPLLSAKGANAPS